VSMATDDTRRYRDNLRDELDGATLYTALSAAEGDPNRKDLFLQLAHAEATHARVWRDKLKAAGVKERAYVPSFRTRLLAKLARRFGPGFVMPTIAAAEFSDRNKYAGQPDAQALSAEERGHAAVVQLIARTSAGGGIITGADIAQGEPWHTAASGNNLRAAVLGASDGLVSNFCLIMGIAGAGAENRAILLTGLAGLIAGACSMALGEWLSVTNARELASTQIAKEAEELEKTPQAEQRELELIYQAKGLPKQDAQRIATELMRDKKSALDTLAREELGIDPAELGGNPVSAAATSFALFSLGAIFPIVSFIWLHGAWAIGASIIASAAALCAIGMLTSLFNGRSAWFSAARQAVFGCAAAGVTYGIGAALGVSLS
jgi:vacuolar iron transporter family protein